MIDVRLEDQMTWSDLGIWSGKTFSEHSAATKEKISGQSSKRQQKWQKGMPAYLDLRGGALA